MKAPGLAKLLPMLLLIGAQARAGDFATVDEYQPDFETAKECRPIDGRKVWKGERAYYIQACLFRTCDSGLLDDEVASVLLFGEDNADMLKDFENACQ